MIRFHYEIRSQKIDNKPGFNYTVPIISIDMFDMNQKQIYSAKSSYNGFESEESIIKSAITAALKGFDEKYLKVKKDIKTNPD